jgi:hypothetical protein
MGNKGRRKLGIVGPEGGQHQIQPARLEIRQQTLGSRALHFHAHAGIPLQKDVGQLGKQMETDTFVGPDAQTANAQLRDVAEFRNRLFPEAQHSFRVTIERFPCLGTAELLALRVVKYLPPDPEITQPLPQGC